MFDQITEYSSDVEWLLQDKQAKEYTILKALFPEHFERTLRLACLINMESAEAVLATCETFANALLTRHSYSSDQDVQEWLDQLLIIACQENLSKGNASLNGGMSLVDFGRRTERKEETDIEMQLWRNLNSLTASERLPYILHSVLFIPVPQIARIFGLKEGVIQDRLETTRKQILAGVNGRVNGVLPYDDEKISAFLCSVYQERWESEQTLREGMESMLVAIQTLVEDKRRERRRRVILQEILLVVIVVVLVFTLVQVAVSLSADPSTGQVPQDWLSTLLDAIF